MMMNMKNTSKLFIHLLLLVFSTTSSESRSVCFPNSQEMCTQKKDAVVQKGNSVRSKISPHTFRCGLYVK